MAHFNIADVSMLLKEKHSGKSDSAILEELDLLCLIGVKQFIISSDDLAAPGGINKSERKFAGIHYRIPERKKFEMICQLIVELFSYIHDKPGELIVSIDNSYRCVGVVMHTTTPDLHGVLQILQNLQRKIFPNYTKYSVEVLCPLCIPMLFWPQDYSKQDFSFKQQVYSYLLWRLKPDDNVCQNNHHLQVNSLLVIFHLHI